jgi:hypothetical protein
MFNLKTFVSSRPDGIGALESVSEACHQPNQPRMVAPLKRIERG